MPVERGDLKVVDAQKFGTFELTNEGDGAKTPSDHHGLIVDLKLI